MTNNLPKKFPHSNLSHDESVLSEMIADQIQWQLRLQVSRVPTIKYSICDTTSKRLFEYRYAGIKLDKTLAKVRYYDRYYAGTGYGPEITEDVIEEIMQEQKVFAELASEEKIDTEEYQNEDTKGYISAITLINHICTTLFAVNIIDASEAITVRDSGLGELDAKAKLNKEVLVASLSQLIAVNNLTKSFQIKGKYINLQIPTSKIQPDADHIESFISKVIQENKQENRIIAKLNEYGLVSNMGDIVFDEFSHHSLHQLLKDCFGYKDLNICRIDEEITKEYRSNIGKYRKKANEGIYRPEVTEGELYSGGDNHYIRKFKHHEVNLLSKGVIDHTNRIEIIEGYLEIPFGNDYAIKIYISEDKLDQVKKEIIDSNEFEAKHYTIHEDKEGTFIVLDR